MIRYFIKKTVVTICLNLAVCFLGIFAFPQIANEFLPAIEIPAVALVYPTTVLSSEEVIQNLISPIEKKLIQTGDVEHIETRIESGKTISFIFCKWTLKPEVCLQKTRQTVTSIPKPIGALDPIFVLHRPTLAPILKVVFHGANIVNLTKAAQEAASETERLSGVAQVKLDGSTPEIALIETDQAKLAQFNIKTSDIITSATQTWSTRHLFAAKDHHSQILQVRLKDIEDLKNMPVVNEAGQKFPLQWVADVKSDHQEPSVYFGKDQSALIFQMIKAPGADALKTVEKTQEVINKIKEKFPEIKTTILYDEAEKIKAAQHDVLSNFRDGIILNSFILIFFLGSISGCIVASAVFPTSLLGSLYIMKIMGISFNIFSLNGFSLATGMITDAGTVLLDAITHRLQKGDSPEDSAWKGTLDVGRGVFTGVITCCAVLFPICFQSGVSSKLFSDLAITLIATNLICLIAVYTLVPWMAARLFSKDATKSKPVEFLYSISCRLVEGVAHLATVAFNKSLASKSFSRAMPLVVAGLSLSCLFFVPASELLPNVKSTSFAITIPFARKELQKNSKLLQQQVAQIIGSSKDIEWVLTTQDDDSINAVVNLKEHGSISEILTPVAQHFHIPESRVLFYPLGPTPPTEPMNYSGYFYINKNIETTQREKIINEYCHSKGISDCTGSEHYTEPAIQLFPELINMAHSQITPVDGIIEAALHLQAVNITPLANLPFSFPTILKKTDNNRLHDKILPSGKYKTYKTQFSDYYESTWTKNESAQFRYDLNSYEPLYFKIDGITIGDAVNLMNDIAKKNQATDDQVLGMGGIQSMQDTFKKMATSLGIATLLVFAIIFFQFKNLAQSLIIMFSVPQAIGGSILGLRIMNETLNAGVIVGFVLLIGIVVNSGIYLIECMNHELERGTSITDAILISIERRVRPILMTKFSCIFGMLPILIFESEGSELYRGMAIVNIFGLCTGTVLTLGVAPILLKKFVKPHGVHHE